MIRRVTTLIAGGRDFNNISLLRHSLIQNKILPTEVVSGGANGADKLGEIWASGNGVPIKQFIPEWDDITVPGAVIKTNKFGKKYNALAGFQRNQLMAEYTASKGGILLAFWDGKSSGTKDMISRAQKAGITEDSCIIIKY